MNTILKAMLLFAFCSFVNPLNSQSEFIQKIKEGIALHDNGDYAGAIKSYEQALEIDPDSDLAQYEISMSYFVKGDYKKAIFYADKVLKHKKSDHLVAAYMTKGNALDVLGKTKESIKLFEKAIKRTEGHYLLHYNLALNHFKLGDIETAERHVFDALDLNINHSSSHLMLANINNEKGKKIPAILNAHFFLFLEPNSERSVQAYDILISNFGSNVKKETNGTDITLTLDGSNARFSAAELMISITMASLIAEDQEVDKDKAFIEVSKSLFEVLKSDDDNYKDIYQLTYIPFFSNIADSKHLETYIKYITQSVNQDSAAWLNENQDKLKAFGAWLENK